MRGQIGVGIIGTGYVASACHGPAVARSADARLAAVLSREESAGQHFLSTLEVDAARAYADQAEFLADPGVELVVVASPDSLHFPQAEASLRSGKHVIVEKPMALSRAEAETLVELAAAQNLVLAVSYHLRCHAGHELLRQRVRDGALGTIRCLRLAWSFPIEESNWRAGSDLARWWSLSATGTHCLDLARWFADDLGEWTRFAAVLNNTRWQGPHDESAAVVAQLASGPTVDVLASIQFEEYTRLEIFGDRGSAVCEGTFGPEGGGAIVLNGQPLDYTRTNPFERQLDRVLAAVNGGSGPPADGVVGLRAVRDLLLADDRQRGRASR